MLNFELRIGLARCRHCTSGHHAAFFTFHFALLTSRRDTFHFPKGPRCDSRCSTLRWLVQHAAWAHAPRCGFQASVPRYCTRRHLSGSIAFLHSRSTPQQALGRHAHKYSFAPCISQRHTAPAQPQPPPEKGAETLLPYKKAGGADIAGDIRTAWCYSVKGSSAMRTWYRCACDAWQPHRCAGIS